ncbi:MAG TPA: diguanylate cyclase, partial [Azonexus sp.]|nr:diguanylate cyclase [Azonexus sp.]
MFIDLDRFKEVNDAMGHQVGDQLLKSVAAAMRDHVRISAIPCRLGGDEFALLLPGMRASAAQVYVEQLHSRLLEAMKLNGWPVTFSIGVASYNVTPGDFDGLLKQADAVIYEVKHGGRNRILLRVLNGGNRARRIPARPARAQKIGAGGPVPRPGDGPPFRDQRFCRSARHRCQARGNRSGLGGAWAQGRTAGFGPGDLPQVAIKAAAAAVARGTAVIAVGDDGSLNTLAQTAHAAGCAMGVIPYGTFNYFARTHGIPTGPAAAARLLLHARPLPVQVAAINDRVFLVNASLGIYPELLQDREAYKARFGRSRWVAFVAACATLLRAQRRLRLHIEMGDTVRDVQTLPLFVGNNRMQLQQFGAEPEDTLAGTPGDGSMAALTLRPIGTLSMIGLMLHGAMGRLGEAAGVESFEFHRMLVKPSLAPGHK